VKIEEAHAIFFLRPEIRGCPAEKSERKAYFNANHGTSPPIPVFQTQFACKLGVYRLNSFVFAITRLLNAQATNRR